MMTLWDLQTEYNKRMSKMMNTIKWKIHKDEVEDYKTRLNAQYRESKKAWDMYWTREVEKESDTLSKVYLNSLGYGRAENMEYERFGTSPVKNAYWAPIIGKEAVGKVYIEAEYGSEQPVRFLTSTQNSGRRRIPENGKGSTMTFKRFPSLLPPDCVGIPENILTKALLGLLDEIGYRFAQGSAILNDSWQINLRETKKGNLMLDMFLRGFDGKAEELKKAWEKQNMGVDVHDELHDLLKVYKDAAEHLASQEKHRLQSLVSCMKDFIKVYEDRKEMDRKYNTLVSKLNPKKECDDCGCDHDEDEDE